MTNPETPAEYSTPGPPPNGPGDGSESDEREPLQQFQEQPAAGGTRHQGSGGEYPVGEPVNLQGSIAAKVKELGLGQVGYEAYKESLVSGQQLPEWADVDPAIKDAWQEAAEAIVDEVVES